MPRNGNLDALGALIESDPRLRDLRTIHLLVLREACNKPVSTAQIADAIQRDHGTAWRYIRELTSRDLLELATNHEDRRIPLVRATKAGLALGEQIGRIGGMRRGRRSAHAEDRAT